MLEKIPIKKDHLLIGGVILSLLICYQFAFKGTISLWQTHKQLKAQSEQQTDAGPHPGYLIRKDQNLDKVLERFKADTTIFRSNIISTIAGIGEQHHVKLIQVPLRDASFENLDFIIQKIVLSGGYADLLKTLNVLQKENNIGAIRSVSLQKKAPDNTSRAAEALFMTIYLEIKK